MIYVVMLGGKICSLYVVGAVMVRSTRKFTILFFSYLFDKVYDC